MTRRVPDDVPTGWMREAACTRYPRLGWVKDPHLVDVREEAAMATVCNRCPALALCQAYVEDADVVGGFWAGHHRTLHGPTLPLAPEGDAA
ncbi:MAG TPA: WhiB family transcriptional regulator [Nocardioidaceae bacterium]|nr:WhiB family transcriptional regulator [Nocardioidaceae bacterium]